MTSTGMTERAMKNSVVALLVAGALLLSASGSALAAGKMGGASGADEFLVTRPETIQREAVGGNEVLPIALGSKLGVGGDG